MALDSEEERQRAGEVLAALAGPLGEASLLAPLEVQLEGLSHFRNQVGCLLRTSALRCTSACHLSCVLLPCVFCRLDFPCSA